MEYIRTLEGDYISAQLIELEEGDPGYDMVLRWNI